MARSAASDLLNNMRFHVTASLPGGVDPLQPRAEGLAERVQAGFNTVTIPEITSEAVEYKEGLMHFPRKYVGAPTVGDVSLNRGVAARDTTFYDLSMRAAKGNGEYRVDLTILEYAREALRGGRGIDPRTADPARTIRCYNAIPTRCKPSADKDSSSGDISIAEIDFAVEDMDLALPTPSST